MNYFLDTESFEHDLAATLLLIQRSAPDYVVPAPRKAVKLLKQFSTQARAIEGKIFYTTAFYWSPSLSRLKGARVAVLDDAVVRGSTLLRHRRRFEAEGALVETFAVYRCGDPDPSISQQQAEMKRDFRAKITRNLTREEYQDYARFVQRRLRAIAPLLEHDHLRFEFRIPPELNRDEREQLLFDAAASLGEATSYPYNLDSDILGVTVLNPLGQTELLDTLAAKGLRSTHCKIRVYLDHKRSILTLIPMVFPEAEFETGPRFDQLLWAELQTLNRELGLNPLSGWPMTGTQLRSPERLVYELLTYAAASKLIRDAVSRSDLPFLLDGVHAATADRSDHKRRFGPELAPLVDALSDQSTAADLIIARLTSGFTGTLELPLVSRASEVSTVTQDGLIPREAESPNPSSLYTLCAAIIHNLEAEYKKAFSHKRPLYDDRRGWCFSDMVRIWPGVPSSMISQAIDFLCDNGYLVPFYPPQPPNASSVHMCRCYRTAEYKELKIGFDAALGVIAYATKVARESITSMRRGIELTFANKLLANVLHDLELFLPEAEFAKLEALSIEAGHFGPEVMVSHLLTAYRPIRISGLTKYQFSMATEVVDSGTPMLCEPEGNVDLLELGTSTASLIDGLIRIYCDAYNQLGRTVQDVLLPMSLYRSREDAYRYMHEDLVLWLSGFTVAVRSSDDLTRVSSLAKAHDDLTAFATKHAGGRTFPRLWNKFAKLATKRNPILANRLRTAIDPAAVDMQSYEPLRKAHQLFEAVHGIADFMISDVEESPNIVQDIARQRVRDQEVVSEERLLIESVGTVPPAEWLDAAVRVCANRLNALPRPAGQLSLLRRQRLHETSKLRFAINAAKKRGTLPFFVLMGDLHRSKDLQIAAETHGLYYYAQILEPLQARIRDLSTSHSGEVFQDPHGDDFSIVIWSAQDAFLFCARLYHNIDALQSEIDKQIAAGLSSDLLIQMKIGLVSVSTFETEEMLRRIHLCSKLIVSSGELLNDGSLHAVLPVDQFPSLAAPLSAPLAQVPEGAVFSWDSERLKNMA